MGLDSVEIVMTWEDTFGISLSDSEVMNLRTPREAIDLIASKLAAIEDPSFCPVMRAFHLVRSGVRAATGDRGRKVRLSESLRSLHSGQPKHEFWNAFEKAAGIEGLRPPLMSFGRTTVRETVELLIARHLKRLVKPHERWTRSLVRYGVRYGVIYQVGKRDFTDDDRFIEDIGID